MADDDDMAVSLADYAFVTAGVSDGLDHEGLLEHRGIEPRSWDRAEIEWLQRITLDATQGGLLALELGELQAAARATWSRAVPPLDTSLSAWVDFQRHLAAQPRPLDHLRELGLLPSDLLRIQEGWTKRLQQDEALRAELAAAMARPPEPVEVPRPEAPRLPSQAAEVAGTSFFTALGDDVEAEAMPFQPATDDEPYRDAPDLLAPLPPPPALEASIDETAALGWRPEALELPFFDDAPAEDPPPVATEASLAPPPSAVPAPPSMGPKPPASSSFVSRPPAAESRRAIDETAAGGIPALGDALPFDADDAPTSVPSPVANHLPTHPEAGATSFLAVDALFPASIATPPAASVDVTMPGGMAPLADPIPFQGEAAPPPSHTATAEPNAPAVGGTAFVSVQRSDAPLPFVAAQSGDQPLVPGGITLPQLAAVVVELESAVGNVHAVLGVYGLDVASYRAHRAALAQRMAQDLAAAAWWESAQQAYRRWKEGGGR
ncbi:MAG: hypothetical protein R3B72_08915 [Polyangiaceae bacterium]